MELVGPTCFPRSSGDANSTEVKHERTTARSIVLSRD
jgi:hypothetical protein